MENQLDLNESEMDYYEEVINDLAEKLKNVQEEKEELQAVSTSLGDRLQRLTQQKNDEIQQLKNDHETEIRVLEQKLHEAEASNSNLHKVNFINFYTSLVVKFSIYFRVWMKKEVRTRVCSNK